MFLFSSLIPLPTLPGLISDGRCIPGDLEVAAECSGNIATGEVAPLMGYGVVCQSKRGREESQFQNLHFTNGIYILVYETGGIPIVF
jgi:hypothetical protein